MILDYLKANTQTIHQSVEKDSLAKHIIQHNISKENYQRFLIQNFKFYHTVENKLSQQNSNIKSTFHPFMTKTKSQALTKDLEQLNYDVNALNSEAYSFQIKSENAALGAMYVSEGSALGGMVIGKHLKNCPELEAISTHHFFGNKPPAILNHWKQFRQVVEDHSPNISDKEEVLEAAISTFQLFGQIMSESHTG